MFKDFGSFLFESTDSEERQKENSQFEYVVNCYFKPKKCAK